MLQTPMVGILGKSRACGTCKRRRKGCDLTRPKCRRCIKASFECTGYSDDVPGAAHVLPSNDLPQFGLQRSRKQQICLPQSLQRSALQSAQFQEAWYSMHPEPAVLKSARSHAWVLDFSEIHVRGTALNYGFAAVALARVGEQRQDPALLRQASVAYTLALARTKDELADSTLALRGESLGSTMLLGLYEAMHARGDNRLSSMRTHLEAASRLIKHRGPAASGSAISQLMLKDLLRTGIWESMLLRKRHFLSSEIWVQEIWKDQAKTASDRMILTIADLPDAFEKLDWLKQLCVSQRTAYGIMDVYSSYNNLMVQLDNVRREAGVTDGGFVYVPSSLLDPVRDQRALESVPLVRRYRTLTEAKIEIDHAIAKVAIYLDLADLHRVAQESGLLEQMLILQQDQWPTKRATVMAALGVMENARIQAQRYCDVIVEVIEQFLLPNVGVAASTSTTLHFIFAGGMLAATGDPRLLYMQTVAHRFAAQSRLPYEQMLRLAGFPG